MNNLENQPAFLTNTLHVPFNDPDLERYRGMTLRQYYAAHSPPAPQWWLELHKKRDQSLNPHNEERKPPIRGEMELMAAWAVDYADALCAALEAKEGQE